MTFKFTNMFKKKVEQENVTEEKTSFSNKSLEDLFLNAVGNKSDEPIIIEQALKTSIQRSVHDDIVDLPEGAAMDNAFNSCGNQFNQFGNTVSVANLAWYASQGFIGHQMCAILAQHWLIDKACLMPAKDATRKGFELTVNDGTEVDPAVLEEIKKLDIKYKLNKNCVEFVKMSRVFGIRIAMFKVLSNDPDYYLKPFNIDGVEPGSYKGIVQIDPYWIVPNLDMEASANPASLYFYEPTWWQVNGQRIHRSHLVIIRTTEVADELKPTYFYGGVPIPQKIYERVSAAERTANEAPHLAMTKRLLVTKIDLGQAVLNQHKFEQRVRHGQYFRDNYAEKFIGLEEEVMQLDTSLADFDAVMMSQYQIVAAAANVPAVKLLGTTPKGFNATGEYEEANYHEELESIQEHDLTPLVERHHELLIKSEIMPKYGIDYFCTSISWNSLDSFTSKEKAEINKHKAEQDVAYIAAAVLSPNDVRTKLVNDKNSGYNGLSIDDEDLENEEQEFFGDPDDDENEMADPNEREIHEKKLKRFWK
jgi:phage-related protein (TIGR01555 family)